MALSLFKKKEPASTGFPPQLPKSNPISPTFPRAGMPSFEMPSFPDSDAPDFPELDEEMDKPPKPPEYDIQGPQFPSPGKLPLSSSQDGTPQAPADLLQLDIPEQKPPEQKPAHMDNLHDLSSAKPLQISQPISISQSMPLSQLMPEINPSPFASFDYEEYLHTIPVRTVASHPKISGPQLHESILITPGPLFVDLEGYKQVLEHLAAIKSDLKKTDEECIILNGDRAKEDSLFGRFENALEQIERKLSIIDKTLFEGE